MPNSPQPPKFNPITAQTPEPSGIPPSPLELGQVPGQGRSPFDLPTDQSPFAPPTKRMPIAEPEPLYEKHEGTPTWREFVNFIMRYGERIQQAEYPNPPNPPTTVDTMWKGVPVKNGPDARIKHTNGSWIEWADCQPS